MYRRLALSLFVTAFLVSCGTRKAVVTSAPKAVNTSQAILDYGMEYLGKPYRYAGKGPDAFDCSGFTSFVFKKFGYKLGASSSEQDRQVPSVEKKEELRIGDLVFFEGRAHNGKVGHVGIVKEISSNGEFRFLHASTGNGVILSRSTEPYYASRYLRGGRVLHEEDNLPSMAQKTSREKPRHEKTNRKRGNAFTPAKAKKQISIEPPKTKTEIAFDSAIVQNEALATAKSDSLVIHSRPAGIPIDSAQNNKEEKKGDIRMENLAMVRPATTSVPKPVESGNALFHRVEAGETLYSVSRKYNCSVEQLRRWNPQLGSVLKAGETLRIFNPFF